MGLPEYLARISNEARELIGAPGSPYEVAIRIWALGMDGTSDEALRDVAWPVWLIWGSLTDRVDGPAGAAPGAADAASADMRRAASEWLAAADDQASRAEYFDRWVYRECGYARPDAN